MTGGSSRHTSPINAPLNTDAPIPPRLRGSPFLAATSSSFSSSSTNSGNQLSLVSTTNIPDSTLPRSIASLSGLAVGAAEMAGPYAQQQQPQQTPPAQTAPVSRAASLSAIKTSSRASPVPERLRSVSSSTITAIAPPNRPDTPIARVAVTTTITIPTSIPASLTLTTSSSSSKKTPLFASTTPIHIPNLVSNHAPVFSSSDEDEDDDSEEGSEEYFDIDMNREYGSPLTAYSIPMPSYPSHPVLSSSPSSALALRLGKGVLPQIQQPPTPFVDQRKKRRGQSTPSLGTTTSGMTSYFQSLGDEMMIGSSVENPLTIPSDVRRILEDAHDIQRFG